MRNPNVQRFYEEPEKFIDLETGDWYYNYDIRYFLRETTDPETDIVDTRLGYEFIQVRISGKPTYEKCVRAIIREYVTMDEEFDLINSYNRDNSDEEYKEYLDLLEEIKSKVKKDFE